MRMNGAKEVSTRRLRRGVDADADADPDGAGGRRRDQ